MTSLYSKSQSRNRNTPKSKELRHFDFSDMLQSGDAVSSGIFMVISKPIMIRSVVRKLSKLRLNSKCLSNQNAIHQFLFC